VSAAHDGERAPGGGLGPGEPWSAWVFGRRENGIREKPLKREHAFQGFLKIAPVEVLGGLSSWSKSPRIAELPAWRGGWNGYGARPSTSGIEGRFERFARSRASGVLSVAQARRLGDLPAQHVRRVVCANRLFHGALL
jgi:hypothetical protein